MPEDDDETLKVTLFDTGSCENILRLSPILDVKKNEPELLTVYNDLAMCSCGDKNHRDNAAEGFKIATDRNLHISWTYPDNQLRLNFGRCGADDRDTIHMSSYQWIYFQTQHLKRILKFLTNLHAAGQFIIRFRREKKRESLSSLMLNCAEFGSLLHWKSCLNTLIFDSLLVMN